MSQLQILNPKQFRELIKGKNIKVTLESTDQNIKSTKLFRSPKLVLSSEITRFGIVGDRHYLQASPVNMITHSGNIIEMSHSDYEAIKWTVEILEGLE